MSLRYKGGVISATPPTTTGGTSGTAPGVWTLEQQMQAQAAGNWPSSPPPATQISRSLRFNSADSAYLNRTPASASNRKTWTWSVWVKRAKLSNDYGGTMISCATGTSDGNSGYFWFYADAIRFQSYNTQFITTTAVYRDVSAWYHVVLAVDTTQATSSNRIKLYVNGTQVTAFAATNYPAQNTDLSINSANSHTIGLGDGVYSNFYLTNIDFIDGQQLTPSSFGQTNSTTGVWEPVQTVGFLTYGTNGFHLDFDDNSGTTSTTLGKDTSGNSNNWTPNNFSVTAGVGNDSLVDSPTSYGTDTGAGGEVRGNYATLNPLFKKDTFNLTNGNLDVTNTTSSQGKCFSTIGMTSGKWYWETRLTTASANALMIGVSTLDNVTQYFGESATSWGWASDNNKYNNGTGTSFGNASNTAGEVYMCALDLDNGKIWFGLNGTWFSSGDPAAGTNAAFTSVSGTLFAGVRPYNNNVGSVNFGQRPFAYTAPSGFKALCTQNLPAPTVVQGDDYFNTVLYTGTGSQQSITGVGFQPDWLWIKVRSTSAGHGIVDAVRGRTKVIYTNATTAEDTSPANTDVASFNSDGFTVDPNYLINLNSNGATYVTWCWKANGAGSSNTAGTITSTVSANTTSGFSIVTYTGTGSSASVGHGLGAAPQMIIVKGRTNTVAWVVYSIGLTPGYEIYLSATNAQASSANFGSAPTSTVFNLGTDTNANGNGVNYVAYCFAPIVGFSAFGKWTGNGSTDGPFIYTGFRPAMIFTKQINTGGENWYLMDNKRSPFNVANDTLYPNLSGAETVDNANVTCDFVSNGFKLRDAYSGWNANGGTYIYAAFAENPFKYSLAR